MKKSIVFLSLATVSSAIFAADLYVTASGSYLGEECYSDIQTAVNAARTGDTVWVEDGFVCDSGVVDDATYGKSRISISKTITVRSFSGNATVTVRGVWHDAENGVALGENAIRCVFLNTGTLVGFRLEGGATQDPGSPSWSTTYQGGGVLVRYATMSNCVVTANTAHKGGGIGNTGNNSAFYDCIFTNNFATDEGGGSNGGGTYYSCRFLCNSSGSANGGMRGGTFTNCYFRGNVSNGSYGAGLIGNDNYCYDCDFVENHATNGSGGAIGYIPHVYNCYFASNTATGTGGAVCGTGAHLSNFASNCTFVANYSGQNGGGAAQIVIGNCDFIENSCRFSGGAAYNSKLYDCNIISNTAFNSTGTEWATGNGGGISGSKPVNCSAYNCVFAGNVSKRRLDKNEEGKDLQSNSVFGCGGAANSATLYNCVVSNNYAMGRGGGVCSCDTYGCFITNNVTDTDGAGVFGGNSYNTIIVGNHAAAGAGGAGWHSLLYNCTLMGNSTESKNNCVNYAYGVNSIVWNNTGTGSDSWVYATNCITTVAVAETVGTGNIQRDPNLFVDRGCAYVPRPNSPCVNNGIVFDWMSDPEDPRAFDFHGRKRIIDKSVDIGACEAKTLPSVFLFR